MTLTNKIILNKWKGRTKEYMKERQKTIPRYGTDYRTRQKIGSRTDGLNGNVLMENEPK